MTLLCLVMLTWTLLVQTALAQVYSPNFVAIDPEVDFTDTRAEPSPEGFEPQDRPEPRIIAVGLTNNCDQGCPRISLPVCGTDGITYGNPCLLQAANCLKKGTVKFSKIGQCKRIIVDPRDLKEERNPCLQPSFTGNCRAAFPRWYFHAKDGRCKRFIYGGCLGNKNNFFTKEECSKHCPPESAFGCAFHYNQAMPDDDYYSEWDQPLVASSAHNCQSLCQKSASCNSWSWIEKVGYFGPGHMVHECLHGSGHLKHENLVEAIGIVTGPRNC